MGGSGGSSGKVDYPDYMKEKHTAWLDEIDTLVDSVGMDNPYATALAYDPDADLAGSQTALELFGSLVSALAGKSEWIDNYNEINSTINDTVIDIPTQVSAFANIMDEDLNNKVLPMYRRGLQDVNAVMSSAFIIGEAIIMLGRNRDLEKLTADLEAKNAGLAFERQKLVLAGTDSSIKHVLSKLEYSKAVAQFTIDFNRIKIVAKKEESEANYGYDELESKWGIDVYKDAGNMLAAISGGTVQGGSKGPSKAQSAIGGAMSGAAMGAMLGGPTPAAPFTATAGAIGGVLLGGIGGLL